jgi:hypothetical protein
MLQEQLDGYIMESIHCDILTDELKNQNNREKEINNELRQSIMLLENQIDN